jgi:hypothetical protein
MKLFQYSSSRDYVLDSLKNGTIHLKCPNDYNDPFDCRLNIYMDGNDELWTAHGQRLGLTEGQLAELRKQSNIPFEKAGIYLKNIQQSALSKTRVSCFSEAPDNILMWSHYADHHRGICTIFETQKHDTIQYLVFEKDDVDYKNPTLPSDHGGIIKVRYDDGLPKAYNHLEYDQNKIAPFLITKSKAWSYENEWRLIFPEHALKRNDIRYK